MSTQAPYAVTCTLTNLEINTPVRVQNDGQDVLVRPGDYIIGDLNGVVHLAAELAEQAIALMGPQAEADAKIAKDLQDGIPFAEASKKYRAGLR